MKDIERWVQGRKSVRTFDGKGLSGEDLEKLRQEAGKMDNPFGIPVEFTFLEAEKYGLGSPVITGESYYVLPRIAVEENTDLAFGYSFERLVLYAWSLGIGTTWIGGTMKRGVFEKALGLKPGERMPCVSPLGYPAAKRSLREGMMRKGVKADQRFPAEKLFFEDSWDTPLAGEERESLAPVLEMVRLAPSAVNHQPWRILKCGERYHFYEKQDKGYVGEATGDLQAIDVGIALCHFLLGLEAYGGEARVERQAPLLPCPQGLIYQVSVEVTRPCHAL